MSVRAVSSIYRTPPWGGVEQDDFYNIVVLVEDPGTDAAGWLRRCRRWSRRPAGSGVIRWGPRTLDADVITVEVHGHPVTSDDPGADPAASAGRRAGLRAGALGGGRPDRGTAGCRTDRRPARRLDTAGITRVGHVH